MALVLPTHKGLCENCLWFGAGIVYYPFGPRRGTLKDPNYDTLLLCPECVKVLEAHDLKLLGERYRDTRPRELTAGDTSTNQEGQ